MLTIYNLSEGKSRRKGVAEKVWPRHLPRHDSVQVRDARTLAREKGGPCLAPWEEGASPLRVTIQC